MLVVCEVALSVMLLIGAGLMIRSFGRLVSQELGYNPEHVITLDMGLPWKKYSTLADQARFFERLKAQVETLPGVQSVGLVRGLPLSGQNVGMSIGIRGAPPPAPGEPWDADYAQVSPGYFRTMNIRLLQGRDFNEQDRTNTLPVTVVNETFVKNFKLRTNTLGRLIDFGGVKNIEIIGGFGVILCLVGLLFTVPYGLAISAGAVTWYERAIAGPAPAPPPGRHRLTFSVRTARPEA